MKPFNLTAVLALPDLPTDLKRLTRLMRRALQSTDPSLRQPIERLLQVNGKKFRPSLVMAVARCQGSAIDYELLTAAAAIEFAHLGSLVHDDLLDNAATRWNAPTISAQAGSQQALLIGDYLFALAFRQAASVSQTIGSKVADAIARMIAGQSMETADLFNIDRSVEGYTAASRGKTGALIAASCEIGALCAGSDQTIISACRRYGKAFGLAFQLIDDLLDIVSTAKRTGKPTGVDIPNGVYTLPLILALHQPANDVLRNQLKRDTIPSRIAIAKQLQTSGALAQTRQKVDAYNRTAARALKSLPDNAVRAGLLQLPAAYTEWALTRTDPALSL